MKGYLQMFIWKSCRYYLSKYCSRVCKRFCKNRKILKILEEVGKKQRDERRGGLDFVAYKDEKIWVVEVKTGEHSELDVSQKQFVERLRREMGIELLHFHVSLNDEIDYSVRCKSRQLPQEDFKASRP
jgi:Holliday junction resolvase-like predicted endonuclease